MGRSAARFASVLLAVAMTPGCASDDAATASGSSTTAVADTGSGSTAAGSGSSGGELPTPSTGSQGSTSGGSTTGVGGTGDGSGPGLAEPECPTLVLDGDLGIHSRQDTLQLPAYTEITGALAISGADKLHDLVAFDCLRKVGGELSIWSNPDLDSVEGLERLQVVGALVIANNPNLVSLEALGIHTITGLPTGIPAQVWPHQIYNNASLEVLGLRHLVSTPNLFVGACTPYAGPGVSQTYGNAAMTEVDGLDALESFDQLSFVGNESLASLDGLMGLAARTGPPVAGGPELKVAFGVNPSLPIAYIMDFWAQYMAGGPLLEATCGNFGEAEYCRC